MDAAFLARRASRGVRRVRRRPQHERPLGDGPRRGHDAATHRRRRGRQRPAVERRRCEHRLLGGRAGRQGRDAAATRRRNGARARVTRRDAVPERLAARRQRAARHGGGRARTSTTSSCSRRTGRRRGRTPRRRADETAARISPDGRWVAYTSDESGRAEVYLDSYPRPGRRVTISSGGGVHPVWRGDGRELYYWRDGALVAVRLGAAVGGAPPARGAQTVLFRAPYQRRRQYDVRRVARRAAVRDRAAALSSASSAAAACRASSSPMKCAFPARWWSRS